MPIIPCLGIVNEKSEAGKILARREKVSLCPGFLRPAAYLDQRLVFPWSARIEETSYQRGPGHMDCGGVVYFSSWHDQTRPFGGDEFLHKSEGYEGTNSVRKPRCFRQRDPCAIDRPFLTVPTLWQHEYSQWMSCPNPQLTASTVKWSSFEPPVILMTFLHSISAGL